MKKIFFLFLIFCLGLSSNMISAQLNSENLKDFQLTKEEYQEFKDYLISKNLTIKDTIYIKYDFNHESCWNRLDEMGKNHINQVLKGFQNHISNFNKTFNTAVAYNFRQTGKSLNKLKLWDTSIILDDKEVLKRLIFKEKVQCGCSAVILGDGSYLLYNKDPHFELLSLHHNYTGKKF